MKETTDHTFNADPGWKRAENVKKEEAKQKDRFEVYNKDGDFFWDHELGKLYQVEVVSSVKETHPHVGDPDGLVERIVKFLNKEDREQKEAARREERRKQGYVEYEGD